jgi:hypothetical protein
MEGGWSMPRPGRFTSGKETRCPLSHSTQGRSGRVWKISPTPGFDPRTIQPVANRCADYAYPAHKSWGSGSSTVLKGCNEILLLFTAVFFPILKNFSKRDARESLLGNCEFREYWRSESQTLLGDIMNFVYIFSTFIFRFLWNSVQEIRTWCCLVFLRFVEVGSGKAVLFLWALMTLRVYREIVLNFQIKECLDKSV